MGPGKARETLSCARPRSRRPGTRGPKRRGTAPSAGRPGGAPGPRLAAGGEVPGLLCSRTSVPRGLLWPGTSDCTEREGEREAVLGRKRSARGTVSKGLLDVETEERNGPGTLPGRAATGGGFLRGSRSWVHLQRQRGVVSAPLCLSITHCTLTTPSSLPAPRASLRRPGRRDGRASRSAQLLAAGRCAPGCACVCTRACVCVEGGVGGDSAVPLETPEPFAHRVQESRRGGPLSRAESEDGASAVSTHRLFPRCLQREPGLRETPL